MGGFCFNLALAEGLSKDCDPSFISGRRLTFCPFFSISSSYWILLFPTDEAEAITESLRRASLCNFSAPDARVSPGGTTLRPSDDSPRICCNYCSSGLTFDSKTLGMTGELWIGDYWIFGAVFSVMADGPALLISCLIFERNLLSSSCELRDWPPVGTSPPRLNSSARYFSRLYSGLLVG